MGWSSWNSFSNTIDSKIVMEQARAIVSTGMRKAGYEYVNIDEGWWLGNRDKNGNIVVDAKQWPAIKTGERAGDMANIIRFIHSLGLKTGIYTDAGEAGCGFYGPDLGPPAPHTGSEGHYEQDFLQFAKWGFDYVKVDWCGGNKENLDPAVQYAEIARAIHRAEVMTGHSLFYSICNWGKQSPWTWAPGVDRMSADIWRTSCDIVAPIVAGTPNGKRRASFTGMLSNFDHGIHPEAQHTGFYNDPDMMVVGMQGLSDAQNRVHMSLWAISGAPLLVGADVPAGSAVMLKISGQDGKQTQYRLSAPSENGERSSLTFANVRSAGKMACIRIAYANRDKSPRFSVLRVNGQMPTTIAFPPRKHTRHDHDRSRSSAVRRE